MFTCLLLCVLIITQVAARSKECIPKHYGRNKMVCVCNATYCDTLPEDLSPAKGQFISYTSNKAGLRFHIDKGAFQNTFSKRRVTTRIEININKTYQTILGWGGAFTDATGINVYSLSNNTQKHLMRSYFTTDGLEYNLCRVPIGGTDFGTRGYSYNDGDEDPDLLNFKLAHEDFLYKIPLIKDAINLRNGTLELFGSAWTAPIWMKHNGKYTGPDVLRHDMYQSWANYHIKFLQAYKAHDIKFWGITTGNEPSTGLVPSNINSVGWLPYDMSTWIAENLGPTIRNSEFSSIKIMTIDDQAFCFPKCIEKIFENEKAKQYVDGFALHWYWNWLFSYKAFEITNAKYPNKFILATEASTGVFPVLVHVNLGDWKRGEDYANDIIQDLSNWVSGWVDWNMALNEQGGPTYINNFVDAPIIVNALVNEFYKQPMYYVLGHFTKFLPKGSQRVMITEKPTLLESVAFSRPDNKTVVIILNRNKYEMPVTITNKEDVYITRTITPKSITTIVF